MLESVVEQWFNQEALDRGHNVCYQRILQSNLPISTPWQASPLPDMQPSSYGYCSLIRQVLIRLVKGCGRTGRTVGSTALHLVYIPYCFLNSLVRTQTPSISSTRYPSLILLLPSPFPLPSTSPSSATSPFSSPPEPSESRKTT